jgi:hypothetical protein
MPDIITFNGITYNSLDEMPADVRSAYERVMGPVADAFDGAAQPRAFTPLDAGQATIVYNGRVYHGLDELPPEARANYEKFQAQFDANHNGMPDMLESMFSGLPTVADVSNQPSRNPEPTAPAFAPSAPIAASVPTSGVVSGEGNNGLRLALIVLAGLGMAVCALAVVVVWALVR